MKETNFHFAERSYAILADARAFAPDRNNDVGNQPMTETLAQYRKRVGRDYYSFDSGDIRHTYSAGVIIAFF